MEEQLLVKRDALTEMMEIQLSFQVRLDKNFLDRTLEQRVAFIKEHSIHLNQEINEMLYELPYFKPWKDYSKMGVEAEQIAMAKARMEMIDAWHFFMNMMIALGFTPEEFLAMYLEKNQENIRRQNEGYSYNKNYREEKK